MSWLSNNRCFKSIVPLALGGLSWNLPSAVGANAAAPAIDPGHSAHGETFSEGPRSAAYHMKGTGDVHFAVTCKSEEAQQFFDQGIGQLHGFWYLEAERSFRTAAAIDPSCVMAYWGMAMANVNNDARAAGFINEAFKRKQSAKLMPLESAWIDTLHDYFGKADGDGKERRKKLISSLKQMREKFPKDLELKAFFVLFVYEEGEKSDYPAASKVLDEIFAEDPHHPAHHYRIHLYESMGNPTGALPSAAQNGPSAPGIAHMWHMCGHTYSSLSRFEDAVWYQEAGARVDHAYMIRDRVMPFQIHNYTHNSEWFVRNLLTVGRAHDAMEMAVNMIDLPRRPVDTGRIGTERLLDTLSTYQMWDETLALCADGTLNDDIDSTQIVRKLRYQGVANAALGHTDAADACIAKLQTQRKKLPPRATPTTHPSTAPATPIRRLWYQLTGATTRPAQAGKRQDRGAADQFEAIDQAIAHIQAQEALQAGNLIKGIALLNAAKERKDHIALACLSGGDVAKAAELASQAKGAGSQAYPLAVQALCLHRAGKKEQAAKLFTTLRGMSEPLDLKVEPFKSLCAIAPDFGYKPDYRIPRKLPADDGPRPPLDSLGPVHWHPSPAPDWSATAADGSTVSLSQYRGKPVIVLFYLGRGCPHCIRQIHDFAEASKKFSAAGISILAIGTDTPDALHETWTLAQTQTGQLTFPLASDASMEIFKRYHCFDDFEKMPLHGTFLIDAKGRIRWQDIGADPFVNTMFLLKESQRLSAVGSRQETVGSRQ